MEEAVAAALGNEAAEVLKAAEAKAMYGLCCTTSLIFQAAEVRAMYKLWCSRERLTLQIYSTLCAGAH